MKDSVSNKFFILLIWILSGGIIFSILYVFSDLVMILALSVLASLIFDPVITFIEKSKLNRMTSSLIVFITFSFLLYFGLSIIIPKLSEQLISLEQSLKTFSLQEQIQKIEDTISSHLPFISKGTISTKIETIFTNAFNDILGSITNLLSNIFSVIAVIVVIPFTTFFIVKDKQKIYKGILNVLPNKYFEMSYWIMKKVSQQLGRFVRGWLIDATFVGIACGIGFAIIGIPYSFALGIIAGVGHLVPYFGPVIGGIPALIISIIHFGNLSAFPLIVLIVSIIYILDNGFVQPYVFSKSVDMHPLVIILLIVAGSQVAGLIGMLLAVPTATILRTTAKEIYFAFRNYQIART